MRAFRPVAGGGLPWPAGKRAAGWRRQRFLMSACRTAPCRVHPPRVGEGLHGPPVCVCIFGSTMKVLPYQGLRAEQVTQSRSAGLRYQVGG